MTWLSNVPGADEPSDVVQRYALVLGIFLRDCAICNDICPDDDLPMHVPEFLAHSPCDIKIQEAALTFITDHAAATPVPDVSAPAKVCNDIGCKCTEVLYDNDA